MTIPRITILWLFFFALGTTCTGDQELHSAIVYENNDCQAKARGYAPSNRRPIYSSPKEMASVCCAKRHNWKKLNFCQIRQCREGTMHKKKSLKESAKKKRALFLFLALQKSVFHSQVLLWWILFSLSCALCLNHNKWLWAYFAFNAIEFKCVIRNLLGMKLFIFNAEQCKKNGSRWKTQINAFNRMFYISTKFELAPLFVRHKNCTSFHSKNMQNE